MAHMIIQGRGHKIEIMSMIRILPPKPVLSSLFCLPYTLI